MIGLRSRRGRDSWTPAVTASAGTFTTVSATGSYEIDGNKIKYEADITITTNGTAATAVRFTLPTTPASATPIDGVESALTGKGLAGYSSTDGKATVFLYDGSYPGADGRFLRVRGEYPMS